MSTALTFHLKRSLYPPSAGKGSFTGDDVLATKRIVSRAGFWPWQEFDDDYSEAFAVGKKDSKGKPLPGQGGVAGWQHALGIKPEKGWYGPLTHAAGLAARVPKGAPHAGDRVWDQFSINLYQGFEDLTAAEKIVVDIFSWWDWMVARESSIHYDQDRPIQPLRAHENPPDLPMDLDCSGAVIYVGWLADALSPDKIYGYGGSGNTGSLVQGGEWISLKDVDRIARSRYVLAFFGESRWKTHHVTALKSSTKNYSHGKEEGPQVYSTVNYGRRDLLGVKAYEVI